MHNFWQKAYNEFTGKAVRRLSASGEQIRTPSEKAFRSYTISTLLMLIAPAVMAFYYYRWRVLLLLAVSISIAALCDAAGAALMRRKPGMDPLYAALTGAMIALLLPASAPLWLPAAGSAFAIVAAKLPFGSAEKTPFVPAAAGIAFLCVCWPELVFTYPAIDSSLPMAVTGSEGFVQGASFASMLKVHNSIDGNILSYFNAVIGKVPGPMGATCMLVMFGTAIAFFIFHSSLWLSSAGFVAVCSVCSVLFPRILTGRKLSLTMEISAGMLVFTALFLLPNPATLPKTHLQRLLYGMAAGGICMMLRYFGAYEEGACFAVLLMNAVWPMADGLIKGHKEKQQAAASATDMKKEGGGMNA